MSDRDRLLFAAAAIGVAICALVWSLVGIAALYHQPNERAAYERTSGDEYQVPAVSRAVPTPPRNPAPERDEWRDESDLQAQWKAADWTFWGAIVSVGSTIAALLGLFFVRESLRLTREQFAAERRPWLTVHATPLSIRQNPDGGEDDLLFRVEATTKNVGLTPALFAVFGGVATDAVVAIPLFPELKAAALEDATRGREWGYENDGRHVFPDAEFSEVVDFRIERQWLALPAGAKLYLYIFYQISPRSRLYCSCQMYDLEWLGDDPLPQQGVPSLDLLHIEETMFGPPPE